MRLPVGTPLGSALAAVVAAAAVLVVVAAAGSVPAAAQQWNSDAAQALAGRAVVRRTRAAADTGLRDYQARAHGFLFFLGQFGEGLTEPPRLIKLDQLELEVYWKAPRLSKQRIIGWRDRAELPTDIRYHADHLGIIQNDFGAFIRLGEGDEVRDVPHPLTVSGLALYDFALGDTVTLELPRRAVRVVALRVRPRDFTQARIVGTLYLDAHAADLVRMAFNFTPAAYLDAQLEDVSIVLDNALWDGRFWLPYRQEIEIRRRATWLDIPARGIIRGRWEIGEYRFNLEPPDRLFAGREIVAAPQAQRDSFRWAEPLETVIRDVAGPVRRSDLERVRAEARRMAGQRALSGLKSRRLGVRRLSDLIRVDRVEGLAVGAGVVWRTASDRLELHLGGRYGFADGNGKASLRATLGGASVDLYREVRDVGDYPVIAPLLNSFSAQELGADYGDYYRAEGGRVAWRGGLGVRGEWAVAAGREWIESLPVTATPASGAFRANPALGPAGVSLVEVSARRKSGGFALRRDVSAELRLEAGRLDGGATYVRLAASGQLLAPAGETRILVRAHAGVANAALPRHRAFVLGGRGSLLGDDFRTWGGTRAALVHAEWRVPLPGVTLGGTLAELPATLTVAPFVAAGWADRPPGGPGATPWRATRGVRATVGAAVELLNVVRLEAGIGVQSGRARVAVDVTRGLWDIL